MARLDQLAIIVGPDMPIDATIRRMAAESRQVAYAGLAVVLDDNGVLRGVVTDGDVRRAFAGGVDWSAPVSTIMVSDPVTVPADLPLDRVPAEVYRRVRRTGRLISDSIRHILVTDEAGRLVTIHDFLELLREQDSRSLNVAVLGMGHVGLTLAASLANQGHFVTGVDVRPEVISRLREGKPHICEAGLTEAVQVNLRRGNLEFVDGLDERRQSVYIVAVGTPLNADGKPDFDALRAAGETVGLRLYRGNLVMLRSTVPVGTTCRFFKPLLEQGSNLVAGEDFHLAFTPERAVEGRAMVELRTLPQIVGGLTPPCTARAANFWTTLTPSVVRLQTLEAAELIKLANNTFRDLSFAFANEIALLADAYNIDSFELIAAANRGYPRNPIPQPSPGVGGYCLTKDSLLLSAPVGKPATTPLLCAVGRRVNEAAACYPIEVLRRFAEETSRTIAQLRVLVIGIAFKGVPETDDMRGSVAVQLAKVLCEEGVTVTGWDAVVAAQAMAEVGVSPVDDLAAAVGTADAVLIMNNHRANIDLGLFAGEHGVMPKLIFDGWSLLDRTEVEAVPGYRYATMGYLTPAKG